MGPLLRSCLTVGAVAAVGCRDSVGTAPVAVPSARVSHTMVCPDPYDLYSCYEDPGDTHVSATIAFSTRVAVTSSEPLPDPDNGGTRTSFEEAAPDVNVNAGYTPSGAVKVTTDFTNGADPGTTAAGQTAQADLTADYLTEVNPNNQQLTTTSPPELSADSPLGLVGTTENGDVTAGVLVNASDTVSASAMRTPAGGPALSVTAVDDSAGAAVRGLARAFAAAERGGVHAAVFNGTPVSLRLEIPGRLVMADEVPMDLPAAAGRQETTSRRRTFARVAVDDLGNSLDRGGPRLRGRSAWVLAEDRVTADADDGVRKIHQEQVATYTNVRWFRNPARDAKRRLARPSREWVPLGGTPQGQSGAASDRSAAGGITGVSFAAGPQLPPGVPPDELRPQLVACDDQCGGGAYTDPVPGPIGNPVECAEEVQAHPVASSPAVNFVFQHGFVSDARTWCDGSNYLRTRFRVGTDVRHSLRFFDEYQNQAAELEGRLQADQQAGFGGPYVFVGHSNGGVISRYVAQNAGGNSGLVRGVVTVSSPLAGAPLAAATDRALTGMLAINAAALFSCRFVSTFVCTRAALITSGTTGVVALLHNVLRNNAPVTAQMAPGNGFHEYMNSRGDPFLWAAVVNLSWDKWTAWRLLGDSRGCGPIQNYRLVGGENPECRGEGRVFVHNVDKTYHRYITSAVVSGLLGFVFPGGHAVARHCAMSAAGLKATDTELSSDGVETSRRR